LEKEQVKKDIGGSSSTDFLNARVAFNNDKSAFLNQELLVLIAQKNLNILLGQDANTRIEVENDIIVPVLILKFDDLLEIAKEKNSNYIISKQNKIIADKNVGLNKSVYYPKLSFNANYGNTDRVVSSDSPLFTSDIKTKSKDGSVSLSLTFNLFNGFRDRLNFQNAKLNAKNQNLALLRSLNDLSGFIREKYISYEKRIEIMKLEEQNVIAARQNLQLLQDLFDVGAASSLEFRDAQVNLARSQSSLIAAKFQARILRIEIDQIAGILTLE
jgi:outer membrane protein TolC